MQDNKPDLTSNNEVIDEQKKLLLQEINEHKKQASLFREQIKMFLRQGLQELPDKQQQQFEELQAKELELQTKIEALESLRVNKSTQ